MTEQPPNPPQTSSPEKLQLDDPSNFPYHAAFLVYSDLFDHAISDDAKKELNLDIEDLKCNKISLETFYMNVARYRGDSLPERRRDRFTVQTQRKKDWRMKSQKQDRIRRHKK
ncbi:MAG TPA: hypothetical protein VMD05_06080 [Candidatus Nanoarchaeia archaeon]|nr:hypothetical protein [Candidatus Nanoarchaeia archaeon]